MNTASLRPLTIGYCRRFVQYGVRNCESTSNAIIKLFHCCTVAIRLPGDASDYNENKRSAVAPRMQNKVVVGRGNSES